MPFRVVFCATCRDESTDSDGDECLQTFYSEWGSEEEYLNYEAWDYSFDELSFLANNGMPNGMYIDDVIEPERMGVDINVTNIRKVELPVKWNPTWKPF